MAAIAAFDSSAYRKLLARTLPTAIKTLREHERMTAELERLDTLGRPLTAEEKVSDVLNGKRGISKSQAKKLADSFTSPPTCSSGHSSPPAKTRPCGLLTHV